MHGQVYFPPRTVHCAHAIPRIIPKIRIRKHAWKETNLPFLLPILSGAAKMAIRQPAVLTFTDGDLIPNPAISLPRIEGSSVSSSLETCLSQLPLSALKKKGSCSNLDTKLQISPSEKQGQWEEAAVLHLVWFRYPGHGWWSCRSRRHYWFIPILFTIYMRRGMEVCVYKNCGMVKLASGTCVD
jgi:hypothetical protein